MWTAIAVASGTSLSTRRVTTRASQRRSKANRNENSMLTATTSKPWAA